MAYTEVTRTSYGSRLKNSAGGIFTGLLLFIGATILLWWNEGRTIKTTRMLNRAQEIAVEMENPNVKDAELDGKLVHAVALATTEDSLSDPTFGIGAVAIKLSRSVEYYQWVEESKTQTKDKIGGGQEHTTTYTYKKEWSSSPVQSENFKDPAYQGKNFTYTTFDDYNAKADRVTFGAYKLNSSQIGSIGGRINMEANIDESIKQQLENVCKDIAKARKGGAISGISSTSDTVKDVVKESAKDLVNSGYKYVHISGNQIYLGENPNIPEIGDLRITFTKVLPTTVSILAKVSGDTFTAHKDKNGQTLSVLYTGERTMDEMFESEHSSNKLISWILRILGVILVIAALKMMISILPTLLKVLPFLGNITETILGLACSVIGFAWSLIVIGVAWLRYRPLIGIPILAAAIALIFWLATKSKSKKNIATNAANNQNINNSI